MEKVKFDDLFDFQKKSTIKAGNGLGLNEGKFPFYTSSNVLTKSLNEFLFETQSLIFGTGGQASVHFCEEKFAVSTDCFVCQPKDKKIVFSKFVFYYLSGNIYLLEDGFKGAGLKHISKAYIQNLQVPLPDLSTQKQIAARLDKAQEIIRYNKQIIEKYDQLTQSLFLDMFGDPVKNEMGWEKKTLKDVCDEIVDCPHSTPNKVDYITEYPCIRTSEIKNSEIDWSSMQYLNQSEYEIRTRRLKPEINDIIYAREGSYGDAVILPRGYNFSLGQRTMLFRANIDLVNPHFLHRLVVSDYVYYQAKRKNSGSTVGHVNVKDIKLFNIFLPPLQLQNQFAERIQKIEVQKQLAKESLQKSRDLFNSLLQQSF